MSAVAWMGAVLAVALPNLVFAWRRRMAKKDKHDQAVLSERQCRSWEAATYVVWTSPTVAFWVLLYFAGMAFQEALFWSILTLAGGLNLLIVGAVVFAVRRSRARC
jgi:hypothetical protein